MKKLDWYILRKFLTTFVFTMLTITVIAVVIDTSEKADDFVKSGLSTWQNCDPLFLWIYPLYHVHDFPADGFYSGHLFQFENGRRSQSLLPSWPEVCAITGCSDLMLVGCYFTGNIFLVCQSVLGTQGE